MAKNHSEKAGWRNAAFLSIYHLLFTIYPVHRFMTIRINKSGRYITDASKSRLAYCLDLDNAARTLL
jgi:hypothetical protein